MEAASHPDTTPAPSPEQTGGKARYTTISIPQPLYQEIKKAIQGTHFRSPTEFLVYVTRLSLQSPIVADGVRARGPPFFAPR